MKKQTHSRQAAAPQVTLIYHKPLMDMSRQEAQTWITDIRTRLERKMQRERIYLERRAARGTRTPTDEAYEADQVLENELLLILNDLLQGLAQEK